MKSRRKKKPEMKFKYRYIKSKNEEEAKEQARKVSMAYDIIFEEADKRMKERGEKGLI